MQKDFIPYVFIRKPIHLNNHQSLSAFLIKIIIIYHSDQRILATSIHVRSEIIITHHDILGLPVIGKTKEQTTQFTESLRPVFHFLIQLFVGIIRIMLVDDITHKRISRRRLNAKPTTVSAT